LERVLGLKLDNGDDDENEMMLSGLNITRKSRFDLWL